MYIKKEKVHILITYLHIFLYLLYIVQKKKNKTRSKNVRKKCSQFKSGLKSRTSLPTYLTHFRPDLLSRSERSLRFIRA